jgi:UDP-N-acetylmuramate dehydrogenase
MRIQENELLAPFTTFAIGGPARWFAQAAAEQDIPQAADWARERSLPLFVLGGGSNLLVGDAGFNGLVLRIALRGITASDAPRPAESPSRPAPRIYEAAAGEPWDALVERAVGDGAAGIECLAGIPGTVGGTPVQNVGAYGQEVAAVIHRVRAFDLRERAFVEFTAPQCAFAYRRSRFNSTDRGRFIVTRVAYRLTPGAAPTLRYAELQQAVEARGPAGSPPSLVEVAAAVRRIRRSKGMLIVAGDPDCRSAGSFFKNPIVSEEHFQEIAARNTGPVPRFPAGPGAENADRVKISAAWLIEHAGFAKGYTLGNAAISSRHALALVNRGPDGRGGATAAEILALAHKISAAVEARFGLRLEMEPETVGL